MKTEDNHKSISPEDIIKLIIHDDQDKLVQSVREELKNGAPNLLGLDILDGHVITVIVLPPNAKLLPFRIVRDTVSKNGNSSVHRYLSIRRPTW